MPSYPLPTLAATVTSAGVTAPGYADILASLQQSFRNIYGQDVYLGADTQDGQMLAVFAEAINDCNAATIAAVLAFSPQTAQGAALSNLVKINGIARAVSSNSSVLLLLGGSVGTVINNGQVSDIYGNVWNLPASVTIPSSGSLTVTATSAQQGAIAAAPYTVNKISTPVLGWSTVTNTAPAALGAPVESDAALRTRQAISVGLPALTVLQSTLAAIQAVPGVTEALVYENDTNATDSNGLPPHSIAAVVQGGAAASIAQAIALKKTPGCYTYGSITQTVVDNAGVTHTIRFFIPINTPITVGVTLHPLNGYTTAIAAQIQASVSAYIAALAIGQPVYIARLYLPAQLYGGDGSATYELTGITLNGGSSDVAIAFNAQAVPGSVTITTV